MSREKPLDFYQNAHVENVKPVTRCRFAGIKRRFYVCRMSQLHNKPAVFLEFFLRVTITRDVQEKNCSDPCNYTITVI